MKFQFVKSILACSIFALGSAALTACGDDSSSGTDGGDGTSSAQEIILSSASETSPMNSASSIMTKVLTDGKGGWELNLSGSLSFDYDFIPEGHDADEDFWFTFDSLSFIVGKYGDDGKAYLVDSLNIDGNVDFPTDKISMAASFSKVPLNQDKIGCGKFVLYVWAYMSVEEDPNLHYTALRSSDFELECKVVESSSSEATVCTELVRDSIIISNYGGETPSMNIDGGTEPQLTVDVVNDVFYLDAGTGITIYEEIGDLISGVDPEPPVCMENITVRNETASTRMEMDKGSLWYVVKTATGSYPFRVAPGSMSSGDFGSLNLIYFRKK